MDLLPIHSPVLPIVLFDHVSIPLFSVTTIDLLSIHSPILCQALFVTIKAVDIALECDIAQSKIAICYQDMISCSVPNCDRVIFFQDSQRCPFNEPIVDQYCPRLDCLGSQDNDRVIVGL